MYYGSIEIVHYRTVRKMELKQFLSCLQLLLRYTWPSCALRNGTHSVTVQKVYDECLVAKVYHMVIIIVS